MKTTISIIFGIICYFLVYAFAVTAQEPVKTVNGGVVNGKASSLPRPVYPESAKAAHISGSIAVNITIDEAGTVIMAEADPYDQRVQKNEDGSKAEPVLADASLKEAAEAAAYQAKFAPTFMDNAPVRVKGKLVYNFLVEDGNKLSMAAPKTVSGGVLNGKAVSLPAPEYPAAAKAVNAGGAVSVQILIDEGGNVIGATAVSGHPLLRAAAETAAQAAKFSPTRLSGEPVKVSGVVTYNFVPAKKPDDQ